MTFKRVFGLPDFSMSLISGDDGLKLSMRVGMTEHGMGEISLFGKAPVTIDPKRVLSGLIEFWPDIAGPYASRDYAAVELNLASILGLSDQDVSFRREGVFISFDQALPKRDLGSYSVVVIECLLRLGRILSQMVAEPQLKIDWQARELETDLLPMPEDNFDFTALNGAASVDPLAWFKDDASVEVKKDETWKETAWYAAKSGQTVEQHCLAAIWLHSRNILAESADRNVTRPTVEDWAFDSLALPGGLPGRDDVLQLAAEASVLTNTDASTVVRDAIYDRNSAARQIFVYRRWFGHQRSRKESLDCQVRGRFYAMLTESPDRLFETVANFVGRKTPCTLIPADEAVAELLRSFVNTCVVLTGEARFISDRPKPVSITVDSVEPDEFGQRFRKRVLNWPGGIS